MASLAELNKEAEIITKERGVGQNTSGRIGTTLSHIVTWADEQLVQKVNSDFSNVADGTIREDLLEESFVRKVNVIGSEYGLKLKEEKERALAAEEFLNQAVRTEKGRAESAEEALTLSVSAEKQRAENAEKEISDLIEQMGIEILYDFSQTATKEELQKAVADQDLLHKEIIESVGFVNARAVKAELNLTLELGKKAGLTDVYTKTDVDKIIASMLGGGNCGCSGDGCMVIDLNAPADELFETLSSNLNKRFMGYLTMGENLFNLFITWSALGQRVEIARMEGMKFEFFAIVRNAEGVIEREDSYIESMY